MQQLVDLVEDSDEEEAEVQSLGLALKKALGHMMPAWVVDLTLSDDAEKPLKVEPPAAIEDASTALVVKAEPDASELCGSGNGQAAQPAVKEEVVAAKTGLKQWEDTAAGCGDASMDGLSQRILQIQSPGSYTS